MAVECVRIILLSFSSFPFLRRVIEDNVTNDDLLELAQHFAGIFLDISTQ